MHRDPLHALCAAILSLLLLSAPASAAGEGHPAFSIAVIPDTQQYLNFRHQTEAGFPFDARELFFQQMAYIARNAKSQGGDIVFATAVGDIWEHPTAKMDPEHAARGLRAVPNPIVDPYLAADNRVLTVEIPMARRGFQLLDGKLPFSVVPGNHDYDANWTDSRYPPAEDPANPGENPFPFGQLHYGGLKNWTSAFGAASEFFAGKPWYVSSFNGGASSAQLFQAGGYHFLHIGLEMAPDDATIVWAESVIRSHPGVPTIVSIHDHLNPAGERKPVAAVDTKLVDPAHHNSPEDLWKKFLSVNDQIFLVLSGHHYGQSRRIDRNEAGHSVIQILADYEKRQQSLNIASGETKAQSKIGSGIGDGWMRLMRFDLSGSQPTLTVRTYSSYFGATAGQLPAYAAFYKSAEKPHLSDAEFLGEEEFTIPLADFRSRFGRPN